MRTLYFIVDGQRLKQDPTCDFNGIVSNSRGYLQAKFNFSADWGGFKKIAIFTGTNDKQYLAPLVRDTCEIPYKALTGDIVQVSVVGQRGSVRIPTNTMEFKQKTGR